MSRADHAGEVSLSMSRSPRSRIRGDVRNSASRRGEHGARRQHVFRRVALPAHVDHPAGADGFRAVVADAAVSSCPRSRSSADSDLALGFQGSIRARSRLEGIRQHGDVARSRPPVVGPSGRLVELSRPVDLGGVRGIHSALMLEVNSGRKRPMRSGQNDARRSLGRTTGVPNAEAGAITQGFRLGTPRSPARRGPCSIQGRIRRAHAADGHA